ncbi:MAG: ATP synthase F1 subunit epsilon [Candidatus Pacebacteria bacterium CG_4_10_14_0_8_um_filter_43_12]|nr:MAG: ATP synthase F1 subunit epsilon [Candidatus Pacebacteria bacterium CG_4_10_14_0_8_um_filter_43_12]
MSKLQLKIVSQERALLDTTVDSVTATTTEGEITILPGHIPLFTKLNTGELIYRIDHKVSSLVISKGFLTLAANNQLTVMADTAVDAREISLQKAQEAIKNAQETLKVTDNQRERIMAEASLRRALLEIKIAERTKRTRI